MEDIRHIATSFEGGIIALAEFEKRVQIFDLTTHCIISEFDTILSFGGERLVISEDGRICVCGSWERHGICGYDTKTGQLVWQRKDLKKVQHIQLLRSDNKKFFTHFEVGRSRILDLETGKDVAIVNGAKYYFESKFKDINIIDKATKIQIVDRHTGKLLQNIKRQSFATLDLAIAETSFAISESGGPLSCYDIESGQLKWEITLNEDGHFLRVCFNETLDKYVGVTWPFMKGGDKKIKFINKETGGVEKEFAINCPTETEFAFDGKFLITSHQTSINIMTGEVRSWV